MITMSCLMMLAWLSLIQEETLPILAIIKQLNSSLLLWAYSITLFLAFVSTGVGCVFGIVTRYENSKFLNNLGEITKRRMIISVAAMIISILLSLVGLRSEERRVGNECIS